MSRSTGPVLAIGGITMANQIIFDNGPADWDSGARVVVATGLVAGMLSIVERAAPDLAVALAWATFATMMLTTLNGRPSPTERLIAWWDDARR